MADRSLQRSRRAKTQTGSPIDDAAYLQEMVRSGSITRAHCSVLAHCGDEAARIMLGWPAGSRSGFWKHGGKDARSNPWALWKKPKPLPWDANEDPENGAGWCFPSVMGWTTQLIDMFRHLSAPSHLRWPCHGGKQCPGAPPPAVINAAYLTSTALVVRCPLHMRDEWHNDGCDGFRDATQVEAERWWTLSVGVETTKRCLDVWQSYLGSLAKSYISAVEAWLSDPSIQNRQHIHACTMRGELPNWLIPFKGDHAAAIADAKRLEVDINEAALTVVKSKLGL